MIRLRERGCRACKHRPPHDIAMGGDAAAVLAHCVVLYADDALCGSDGPARSGQGVDRLSGLDGIAEEGIAGCIAFRTCDDAESCRRPAVIDRLAQVMGMRDGGACSSGRSLADRFKGAQCCLLAPAGSAALTAPLGFESVDAFDASETKLDGMIARLREANSKHVLTVVQLPVGGALDSLDAAVSRVMEEVIDPRDTMLVVIAGQGDAAPPNADDLLPAAIQSGHAHGFRVPVQSVQVWDGEPIDDWGRGGVAVAVHASPHYARRDNLARFPSPIQAARRGGHGLILAQSFIAGAMFSLGCAPKYGA